MANNNKALLTITKFLLRPLLPHARAYMCSWRHLALLFLLPCLFRRPRSTAAASDTLSAGDSLTGNRTLVSAGGEFELGFFSPAGNPGCYYVGIWYKRIPGRTVIWVMNRDSPATDPSSAELTVAQDGSLLLLLLTGDRSKEAIWSANPTRPCDEGTAVAVLLDTGNLVLRGRRGGGDPSAIVWQSFDHPTDTLVPGGWVGLNRSSGAYQALRSWRSASDPSTGLYTDRVDPRGSAQYVFLWSDTTVYHYVGAWNGRYFVPIPEMGTSPAKYTFAFVNSSEEVSYSFRVNDPSTVSRLVMSPHGQLTMYDWSHASGQWLLHWATPTSQCDVYSVCGPFGLCDVSSSQYCRCLPGFEPAVRGEWVNQLWGAGCARKTSLQCSGDASSTTDGFLPLQNVQLPGGYSPVAGAGSSGDCASACLRNCSCTAYAYGDSCLVWDGDLRNVQQLSVGDAGASTLFLRVAAADLVAANAKQRDGRFPILGVSAAIVLVILCMLLLIIAWVRRRGESETVHHDGSLLVFSYGYLAQCTKNYSQKLGMGSFGSVYRGTLPDHTAVAVKRLEGSAQGEKQFRTEVRTLGTIQHVNLVRLRGFCATRHERLLVYDYMPNGSLASVLSGHSFRLLDWRTRFGIMVGVARGLAYLHEQCHERIVHCDVKPENILLDAAFCPKVADFGMAKLIVRDFSHALTTARGTVGYLAPEWILGLPITAKADVYSYGMMLLELISGRRNREAAAPGAGGCYFPLWAATKVREGQFLALLDERLAGDADVEELGRACKVACWCIQQSEALRPTMGHVVQVLEGSLLVGTAPVPRFLEHLCAEDSCTF